MIVIDPFDEHCATDEDGTLMAAVQWLPLKDDEQPPTVNDFDGAPIVGYIRPDGITSQPDEPT